MKKLLIATMTAVSVGLCAKAADAGFISGTSFDDLQADANFAFDDDYWPNPADATDEFKIVNVTYPEGATKQHWEWTDGEKALSIDTGTPILRNANRKDDVSGKNEALDVSETPVFFDSVVQFTATEVAPNTDGNKTDKLIVWLYSSREGVSKDNPGDLDETEAVTNLVITAGKWVNGGLTTKHYLTNIPIEPDSWHRLTIKSFEDSDFDKFTVWVDSTLVVAEGVEAFDSLIDALQTVNGTKLQGVAFDGKGAVDDIVFTTTAPEFTKEDEPEDPKVFALNLSISADEVAEAAVLTVYADGEEALLEEDGSCKLNVGTENALAWVYCAEGYKVINEGATYDEEGGYWIVPINVAGATENGTVNVTITVEEAGGGSGEEPEEPEVPATPTIGGEGVKDADEFIAAANSGVAIKVPTDWTLDGNTLKYANGDAYATFADYYTVELASDGTVTLKLNDKAKPEIDETAADKGDAIVVTDATVALGVTNAKSGLWYGAQAYSDAACTTVLGGVTGWEKADGETVTVTATKPEADKAFFKVVVTDIAPKSTEE